MFEVMGIYYEGDSKCCVKLGEYETLSDAKVAKREFEKKYPNEGDIEIFENGCCLFI